MDGTRARKPVHWCAARRWARQRRPCLKLHSQETPVGVEPTSSCFADSRLAVGLRRRKHRPFAGATDALIVILL